MSTFVFIGIVVIPLFALFIAFCIGKKQKEEEEQLHDDIELQYANAGSSNKDPNTNLKLDNCNIEIVRRIGSGRYGEVYYGTWLGGTPVALKHVKTQPQFLSSLGKLTKLCHPNIGTVFGYFEDEYHRRYIAMEFMPKGNLREFLFTSEGKLLTQKHFVKMSKDIASGMCYLHEKNVIHKDLGARNVFVLGDVNEYVLKITDFGMAEVVDPSSIQVSPVKWFAPEVLEKQPFSFKSDVWSFAVTLWEMYMFGIEPYSKLQNSDITPELLQTPLHKPNKCPNEVYQLMLHCWEIDPQSRPDFTYITKTLENIFNKTEDDTSSGSFQSLPLLVPKELGRQDQCKTLGWVGQVDRVEAEKMLANTPIGTFLIRYSPKRKSYVLSTRNRDGHGFLHIADIFASDDRIIVKTTKGQIHYKTIFEYLAAMKKSNVISTSIHEAVVEMPSVYMNHLMLQEKLADEKPQKKDDDPIVYCNQKTDEQCYVNENKHNSSTPSNTKTLEEQFYVNENNNNAKNLIEQFYVNENSNATSNTNFHEQIYVNQNTTHSPNSNNQPQITEDSKQFYVTDHTEQIANQTNNNNQQFDLLDAGVYVTQQTKPPPTSHYAFEDHDAPIYVNTTKAPESHYANRSD